MSNFPWLTVIGVIPLLGAAVVAALPAGLADQAKRVALGFSLVTLVLGVLPGPVLDLAAVAGEFIR